MSPRYADDRFDLGITASPRLSRGMRLALILLGLLLVPLSLPLAFGFAIISGGGHGSPFDGGAAEFAFGITFLTVPLLILLLGIVALACDGHNENGGGGYWRDRCRVGSLAGLGPALLSSCAVVVELAQFALKSKPA